MAVSTRKLIELSFLALLDAGIDYRGKNIGCYASATAFDMQSIAEPVGAPRYPSFPPCILTISYRTKWRREARWPASRAW